MAAVSDYEARRLENIRRNRELVNNLGIARRDADGPPAKRRKVKAEAIDARPSRTSARIASAPKPDYRAEETRVEAPRREKKTKAGAGQKASKERQEEAKPPPDIDALVASWSAWTATEPEPTRDPITKEFRFASHPEFTPNKSPEEVLREGCFGGTYFRPLASRTLGITIQDDWRELPADWVAGLAAEKVLTSSTYDPDVNKYRVAAGQTVEDWEAAGWIDHGHDVRGWFQWYCRFWQGRRCGDDARQVRRWRNCVGETGRWRLALLRRYVRAGVRDVFDDGEDERAAEVSPVIHQTCHHWAFEVRQDVLDAFWARPR